MNTQDAASTGAPSSNPLGECGTKHAGSAVSSSRLLGLDALRGIAATSVMLFHYYSTLHARVPEFSDLGYDTLVFTAPWGRFGVQLFFIISGFVILMTAERCAADGAGRGFGRGVLEFGVSRFARLYPAFWVACVLTYTGIRVFGYPDYHVTPVQALLNLPMMSFPGAKPIEGVYWTLRQEMWFYMVIAWLLLINRLRWALPVMACIVVTSLCTLAFTRWMSLFLIGMVLFDSRKAFRPLHGALLALCAADVIRRTCFASKPGDELGWWYVLAIGVCALLVLGATRGWLRWLAVPPLLFLGRISYSLYLIHASLGQILIRELVHRGIHIEAAIPITIGAAILAAWLLHVCVEAPAGKAVRAWHAGRKARCGQPAGKQEAGQTTISPAR